MKVIMLKDVKGVGRRGTAVEVSDGYGLNYLVANGFAEQATPAKLAKLQDTLQREATSIAARQKKWDDQVKLINGATVIVAARANDQGKLFNQLSPDLITAGIHEMFHIEIPPEALVINAPIKQIGDTSIQIRLGESTAHVTVTVMQAS